MALSTQAAKRRCSYIEISNNPLENSSSSSSNSPSNPAHNGIGSSLLDNSHELKIENLVDTVKIEPDDLNEIIQALQRTKENVTRIRVLHTMKVPYLFTSADLLKILEVTASVKTRISFITEIGPRLVDPKAKSTEIIDLFRYVDDRTAVEEILKARALTVAKMSSFQSAKPLTSGRGGTLGGRGGSMSGRGRGGRLSGRGTAARPTQIDKSSSVEEQPQEKPPALPSPLYSPSQITAATTESESASASSVPSPSPRRAATSEQSLPVSTTVPASPEELDPQPSLTDNTLPSTTNQGDQEKSVVDVTKTVAPKSSGSSSQNPSSSRNPFHSPAAGSTSVSVPVPQRRYSKIGVTASVIKTLGLSEKLDEISLEGVPLESWELKARHQSQEVNSLLSDEDNRRLQSAAEIKRTLPLSHPSRLNSQLETSPEEDENGIEDLEVDGEAAKEEKEPSVIQRIVRSLSFRTETPVPLPDPDPIDLSATPTTPPSATSAEEEEGVVGWMKRRLSFKGDPDLQSASPAATTLPVSTLPQISSNQVPLPVPPAPPDEQFAAAPAEEGEGVVDWIKRRLSFQADPSAAPRSTLTPTSSSSPPPLPVEPSPVEVQQAKETETETEGVIGFLKRRLSFRSETELTAAATAPPPSTLPKRTSTVAKIFSVDWVEPEDEFSPPPAPAAPASAHVPPTLHPRASASVSEVSPESERKGRKTIFSSWFKKKEKDPSSAFDSSSGGGEAMDSTTHSLPPPETTSSSSLQLLPSTRPKRSKSNDGNNDGTGNEDKEDDIVRKSITRPSVKKLQEEKRVGFMRGLFEGLTGGGGGTNKSSSQKKEEKNSPQVSSVGTGTGITGGPPDDKRQAYLDMKPESSLGIDSLTGRVLYSYPELVRQNYLKDFRPQVDSQRLEEHLSDGEFLLRFNMSKEAFAGLPKWRRSERKKTLMLF